jgi:hypothetical protein
MQDEVSVEHNPRIRYLRERGDTGLDYKVPLVIDEIDEDALKEKIKEDMVGSYSFKPLLSFQSFRLEWSGVEWLMV